ncbi:MAG: transcriptional regulator GcvA [Gammaproteobacteria bacterium]|nr:transcriptional regulator GcvA [Gammaproteobacteria bacterium]
MSVRLPPIAALRALEAAARHLSYTRAADELHITQSAVSHQIRHLEQLWGVKLFARRGRRLLLTENGQALVPVVRNFFEQLTTTLKAFQSDEDSGALRVSLLQSFAVKWLVPRLGSFNTDHPGIDVWISTSEELVDLEAGEADLAIRLGHGNYPGLQVTPMLTEYVFPVCSPNFLERFGEPAEPADLLGYPLLYRHSQDICPRWRDWFRDAGVEVKSLPKGSRFPETSMAIQAAMDGQGIALARSAHVGHDLAAQRLVKLFNVYSRSSVAYYIVCPQRTEHRARIDAFRQWLLEQAAVAQVEYDRVAGHIEKAVASG